MTEFVKCRDPKCRTKRPHAHPLKINVPSVAHRQFRDDALALLKKHTEAGNLSGLELLALTSHLVGQVIAMQDQRSVTREVAMQIVSANIEQGNREMIDNVMASTGSA